MHLQISAHSSILLHPAPKTCIYIYVIATGIIEIIIINIKDDPLIIQNWGMKGVLTSSMDWSSTTLQSKAPTNASPAPVVSTVFTWKASTAPWKFYAYAKNK
jgi:hypothetical protein